MAKGHKDTQNNYLTIKVLSPFYELLHYDSSFLCTQGSSLLHITLPLATTEGAR